jgi:hypothetical protein
MFFYPGESFKFKVDIPINGSQERETIIRNYTPISGPKK